MLSYRNTCKQQSQYIPSIGITAIEQRSAIEDALYNLLEKYGSFVYKQGIYAQIAPALAQFQVRLSCLPYAPRIEPVTRAQNLLQMAPYILVVDQPLEPKVVILSISLLRTAKIRCSLIKSSRPHAHRRLWRTLLKTF